MTSRMIRAAAYSALGVVLLVALPAPLHAQPAPRGKVVYDKWCAGCHGETGAGDGPAAAFMLPRPRDFTRGVFKIRTTASGEIPTDADLRRVIDDGMPGTAMPEWRSLLSERERDDLVAYVKGFSTFFADAAAKPIDFGRAPAASDEAIADGRATYTKLECFKCHGPAARGDGTSAPTLQDDWDYPIRAADLTKSWNFRGGGTVEEIYARLRTGLDGTPMPSFADAIDNKVITEEQLWHVAQYVGSLSPERQPEVREVMRARRVDSLPAGADDRAWGAAERYWVPLVGQVIAKPRWFAPTVDGLWVEALHDGRRLALRLSWADPSQSPDPAWDEWLGRVSQAMTDVDGPLAVRQGPDRLTVQFPPTLAEGAEPPYFLQGTARRPVHIWRWTSMPDVVEEGTAAGIGTFTPRPGAPQVTHARRFDDGEWRLQLTRALVPADTGRAPPFVAGEAVPVGFFAADGSNGEDELRGAISAWYAIYLDVPTPPRVYVAPALSVLLTAGLGVIVVSRAQRRERRAAQPQRRVQ